MSDRGEKKTYYRGAKIRIIAVFLSEAMQVRSQQSDTFYVPKEQNCQKYLSKIKHTIPSKQKWKKKKVNYKQSCTTRNVEGISSDRSNIVSDRNVVLHREIQSARNVINEGKYVILY